MTAGVRTSTPVDALDLSPRAREACAAVGARTVGDLLALSEEKVLATPGLGKKTWTEIRNILDAFLSTRQAAHADPRPLAALIDDARCRKAFDRLGIRTVGEFFATPKETLLAIPGFGRKSYEKVFELVGRSVAERDLVGLPPGLLGLSITGLRLGPEHEAVLTGFGDRTVGEVLSRPSAVWEDDGALSALADALEVVVQNGLDDAECAPEDHVGAVRRVVDILDVWYPDLTSTDRDLVRWRIGYRCRPCGLDRLALRWQADPEELARREDALRRGLVLRAAEPLMRMRIELTRDLEAFDGLLRGEQLAAGSAARELARRVNDEGLPLRLAAFAFPEHFRMLDDKLTNLPANSIHKAARQAQLVVASRRLPMPLEKLQEAVEEHAGPFPRSALEHVLRHRLRLTVRMDAQRGELVVRRRLRLEDRLEEILWDSVEPASIDDLVFAHRDRFRTVARAKVLECLRADGRFLEVGPGTWALRERHVDELELSRAEAERIAQVIQERGGQQDVRMLGHSVLSDRSAYLLIDLLRRDRDLRDLGRGIFCPRIRGRSAVVRDLCKQLKRAMGEVPMERFVQNQPEQRRRLTITLLDRNRLFVSPQPDRIDLLENYPFNAERMRRLMNTVDVCLEQGGNGYAGLDTVLAAVQEADLGGSFLTEHMLLDLLRRHGTGTYEFLADGRILARKELGLGAWIQKKAREVLRDAGGEPMTPQQVVCERPELAEFGDAIIRLMESDPLIRCEDGVAFRVV